MFKHIYHIYLIAFLTICSCVNTSDTIITAESAFKTFDGWPSTQVTGSLSCRQLTKFFRNAAGHGFFAGTNDFVQIDTDSVVEFGEGYVLKVDEHGNRLSYLNFRVPRHTEVMSISLLASENLV